MIGMMLELAQRMLGSIISQWLLSVVVFAGISFQGPVSITEAPALLNGVLISTDQRGRIRSDRCDIGAFEFAQ